MKGHTFADDEETSALQMAGWKTNIKNSSTTESELWRNAGPSAFQLKCWHVTKYDVHILFLWLAVSGYELFERPSYLPGTGRVGSPASFSRLSRLSCYQWTPALGWLLLPAPYFKQWIAMPLPQRDRYVIKKCSLVSWDFYAVFSDSRPHRQQLPT